MKDSDSKDVGNWSGPIKDLTEGERRTPADSMSGPVNRQVAFSDALRNKWFEIWYQPKIDLKRKRLAGAEALARVRHPQLGVLPPANFLPSGDDKSAAELAQQSLLATLFDWTTFEEAGFNLHLSISVPLSVLFKLPIPRLVAQYRPHSKRWPGLILEVKADDIARNAHLSKEIATQLRVGGISIAIDDFGAGFTSLASLRDLPFAEIKIDQSLVSGCATDAANAALCQTVIDLAHRFGGVAVADGVEKTSDLEALTAIGCDYGQGVSIAPPMPKSRFLDLLRARMSNKPAASPAATKSAEKPVGQVA